MSAQIKTKIVSIIRSDFDQTPKYWEGAGWYDNAEEVADDIIALFPSPAPAAVEELVARLGAVADLLGKQDERQTKLHDLLETIREQIRLGVPPEHRPDGLFKNIQNAVYAMRGRMPLLNDAAITSPLAEAATALTAAQARIRELEESIWLAHDQLNTYRGAAIEEVLEKFEMYIPGLSGQVPTEAPDV